MYAEHQPKAKLYYLIFPEQCKVAFVFFCTKADVDNREMSSIRAPRVRGAARRKSSGFWLHSSGEVLSRCQIREREWERRACRFLLEILFFSLPPQACWFIYSAFLIAPMFRLSLVRRTQKSGMRITLIVALNYADQSGNKIQYFGKKLTEHAREWKKLLWCLSRFFKWGKTPNKSQNTRVTAFGLNLQSSGRRDNQITFNKSWFDEETGVVCPKQGACVKAQSGQREKSL